MIADGCGAVVVLGSDRSNTAPHACGWPDERAPESDPFKLKHSSACSRWAACLSNGAPSVRRPAVVADEIVIARLTTAARRPAAHMLPGEQVRKLCGCARRRSWADRASRLCRNLRAKSD